MTDRMTDVHVVTNMAYVLKEFLNKMNEDFPTASCVYDERLSYETALRNWRAKQNSLGTQASFLPAFVFKRSVLRHTDHGISRRAPFCKVLNKDGASADVYKMIRGELEVQWMYVNDRMSAIEKYEIAYLADCGLAGNKELKVLIPDFGEFTYYVHYERDLQEKTIEHDENYYKGVMGVARITGQYLLFDQTSALIQSAELSIQDYDGFVFNQYTI